MKTIHARRPLMAAMTVFVLLATTPLATLAGWISLFSQDFSSTEGLHRWSYSGAQLDEEDLFRVEDNELKATWDAGAGLGPADDDPREIVTSHFSAELGLSLSATDSFRVRAAIRIDALNNRDFYQIANFGLFNSADMGHNRTWVDGSTDVRNLAEFNYWITPNDPEDIYANGAQIGPVVISDDGVWVINGDDTELGEATLPTEKTLHAELYYDGLTRMARAMLFTDADYTNVLHVNGTPMQEWTGVQQAGEDFHLTHVGFFNYVAADGWGSGEPLHGVGGTGAFQNIQVDYIPEPGTMAFLATGLAISGLLRRRFRKLESG